MMADSIHAGRSDASHAPAEGALARVAAASTGGTRWRVAGRVMTCVALLLGVACSTPTGNPRRVPVGHTGAFESWWSDTQLREVGEYLDGQRHGPITIYHSDGSLQERGEYSHGVPSGRHELYHPGGVLALVETVTDGVIDGERLEYDEAGQLHARQTWSRGRRDGPQVIYHPNGSVAREGAWRDDLPVGRWRSFDEQGQLRSEEWFWAADGRPVGYLETVFVAEGRVSAQAYKVWSDGHWDGWRSFWHENGVQAGLVEYHDDLREGRDFAWSRSGQPLVEGFRRGDRRVGRWRFYDESGELVDVRELGDPSEDDPQG